MWVALVKVRLVGVVVGVVSLLVVVPALTVPLGVVVVVVGVVLVGVGGWLHVLVRVGVHVVVAPLILPR